MSNENYKSTSSSASISNNFTTNISATTVTSLTAITPSTTSVSSPLPVSLAESTSHFDATVNAIAAAVNASTNLCGTPPDAAVVVAVAVSSLAAAIIPDTPIVSIAGLTLSEITTTTTSTRTTPTPIPTNKETNTSKNPIKKDNFKSKSSDSLQTLRPSSSVSVKQPDHQMSIAKLSIEGAITNATCSASNVSADNENQTISFTSSKATASRRTDSSLGITSTAETSLSPIQTPINANVVATKCDAISDTPNDSKSKDILSDSWEERRLNDWDDNELKELLDEAYSYKTPRDKENKSKTFLQLLEKVQNDDQSYKLRAINSRGTRNLSSSITSSSYHHYQNPHYHSHSHNSNNRSHHHHKQGGSLQDLFEIGLHETQLDCDQSFGSGIGGNQRNRRQNHNSRQKKFSSSVSSRQREGGSLPSNVNVTHQLSGSSGNELGFMQQDIASASCKASKKEQRRNASKANAGGPAPLSLETKESSASTTADTSPTQHPAVISSADNTGVATFVTHGGDFIIDMGEPIIDIQQQQQILQGKGPDSTKQGQSYYERLVSIDKHIPRVNLIGSSKSSYFAPTTSHCYVDEAVRFNTLERNGVTAPTNNSNGTPTTVDAKFLPLDENYKACKSVLGGEGEKSVDQIGKPKTNSSIYTKITPPACGTSGIGGISNNIGGTINQSPLDENGNALNELYQNSSAAGATVTRTIMPLNCVSPSTAIPASGGILLTSCGGNNVSTSATVTIPPHPTSNSVSTSATITTYATGPSQAKAKAKKKSQQERNTKTVDVESVAGYRGKDPVEELVKYIESSGEGGSSKSGDKKKDRKKDKEKHQKLKKSNSLEELRSGAKMEVHELKRTAATTESNAVVLRQKTGTGGGKQGKNNSSSTADINKHLDNKPSNSNTRKSDRRSWGNEDLKYISDQQNANIVSANEEKSVAGPTTINISAPILPKERKNVKGSATFANKEERELKERTTERNERNLTNNVPNNINVTQLQQSEKIEKADKLEKAEKSEKSERRKRYDTPPNAVTIIDIVPMESSCPETAEFHVVTKKKKPKKPKVITNAEETSVTFNRTHNFTIPKSSTQSIPRYKYHQQDVNTLSGNQQPLQQNSNSFGGVGSVASNNYSPSTASQTQYPHSSDSYNNTDKSRRKSTSSVPPSEKSDSSDLDSVHSLPIESTKANATKDISQAKSRNLKSDMSALAQSKNNSNAPISYADIARTNKEIADAAAAFTDTTSYDIKTPDTCVVEDRPCSDDKSNVTSNPIKIPKSKKSHTKQDFPELVNPVTVAPVTYSQSLSTTANTTQIQLATGAQLNEAAPPPTTQSDVIAKASLPPDQCHPPQTLQKSKSVENDFTTSNSTSSYMVPLNSNSLDQQYPALEKTVKRHSSANIGANYMIPNQQTSAFNFAAAAKQQISNSNTEPTHVISNKNAALTTSITSTNTQTAQIIPGASNATIDNITTTNTNNITSNTNRKSKEKSPPMTSQTSTQETMNSKKTKKERQQLQPSADVSTTTQTKANSSLTARKPYRSQPKSSSSLAHTASTQANPRPAVIILNDDRNSSGCAADNQFTFGDFNEDELKLFEDDVTSDNKCADCNTMNVLDTPSELTENTKDPCDGETSNIISQGETYFNDSGASCENDIGNNSASDMLLNSSIDASSPNTSFANNNHTSRGGGAGVHMSAGNNQSSDSGIYTDRTKTSSSCYQQTTVKQNKHTSPIKDDNKLNTFLSNTKCTSVHTSMDSLDPPPQQLETCNEIETAIIAAARAAAKNQQQNPQQQKFKNSNTSSNSSSFSSSSLSSNTAVASCHSNNNSQILNQHVYSYGSNSHLPNQQLETQICHIADSENDESFDNIQHRSRSPSRPRRISIQFIPPTMATALTTQQHNEIIVDFIGSAWEEIANSKVTKVYDGQ